MNHQFVHTVGHSRDWLSVISGNGNGPPTMTPKRRGQGPDETPPKRTKPKVMYIAETNRQVTVTKWGPVMSLIQLGDSLEMAIPTNGLDEKSLRQRDADEKAYKFRH